MQPQTPHAGVTENRAHSLAFWSVAVALVLLLYWLCLRFLQPGYFSPEAVYHIDFYDYAGMRMKSAMGLLLKYPRPVAYLAMKLLGYGGLYGSMMGAVAIALVNLLLTILYVRRLFPTRTLWLLPAVSIYLLLNLAHPSFYVEHRHDLPAQVSYLFLIVSLLAWTSWINLSDRREARPLTKTALLLGAIVSALCFAFSKETYFVSAICLLVGLAVSDPRRRSRHLYFLAFILVIEVASLLWTRHVNSPFVNPNAAVESTYRISIAPLSVIRTFLFYAYVLMTPAVLVAVVASLLIAWRNRLPMLHAIAFPVAGLAAFAPHAILPNHRFAEYAWAGAPLALVPILFIGAGAAAQRSTIKQLAAFALLSVIAIVGPDGYTSRYKTEELEWVKSQEKRNEAIVRSFDALEAVPARSRILVIGLDDGVVPWQVADFIRSRFGDDIYWTVVFPPKVEFRRSSRLTAFANPADVQLTDFNYVAMYRPTGELVELRPVKGIQHPQQLSASYVPALAAMINDSCTPPTDAVPLLDCAAASLEWGFGSDAIGFLKQAQSLGADRSDRYAELLAKASAMEAQQQAAQTIAAELTANPSIIQSDGSGLGVTRVSWRVPDGIAVEVHVDAPDGPMLAAATASGHADTEKWVRNGTEFFLQNVTGGKPLTRGNTLATLKIRVLQ